MFGDYVSSVGLDTVGGGERIDYTDHKRLRLRSVYTKFVFTREQLHIALRVGDIHGENSYRTGYCQHVSYAFVQLFLGLDWYVKTRPRFVMTLFQILYSLKINNLFLVEYSISHFFVVFSSCNQIQI